MKPTCDHVLLTLTASLVLATVAETFWPHPLETPNRRPAVPVEPVAHGFRDAVPLPERANYRDIAQQPLFTQDRQPYRVPIETPRESRQAAPVPRPQFHLSAVIETPAARIALLGHDRSSNVERLTVGERIDGWTLVEIKPHAVLLRQGEATMTVEMQPDKGESA